MRPGVGLGRAVEPVGVEVAERDVELEDRPAGPEPVALVERGEPTVVARVGEGPARDRLDQRGAAVIDLERFGPHPGRGRRPVGPGQAREDELLADPGGLLPGRPDASDASGRLVDLDDQRLVAEDPIARRERAGRRGRDLDVGLAGDPGEAERGQVDDGPDPVLGELRGAERAFGPEVGRRVGQEHGRAPRDAQGVDHEVAGPARRPGADEPSGQDPGPGRFLAVEPRPGLVEPARLQCRLGVGEITLARVRCPGREAEGEGAEGAQGVDPGAEPGVLARREIGSRVAPRDRLGQVGGDVLVGLGPEASRTVGRSGGSSR